MLHILRLKIRNSLCEISDVDLSLNFYLNPYILYVGGALYQNSLITYLLGYLTTAMYSHVISFWKKTQYVPFLTSNHFCTKLHETCETRNIHMWKPDGSVRIIVYMSLKHFIMSHHAHPIWLVTHHFSVHLVFFCSVVLLLFYSFWNQDMQTVLLLTHQGFWGKPGFPDTLLFLF